MTRRAWIFVGLLVAAGCGGAEGVAPDINNQEQGIIGGTTDNGDPSVVLIFAHKSGSSSGSICTGTVISEHAVLTAAHCVDPRVVGKGNVFDVLTGTRPSLSNSLAVSSTAFDDKFDPEKPEDGHDVGIVTLRDATTLAPIPFNQTALTDSANGASVRLIGYGVSSHRGTGAGTKRQVTTTINDFDDLLIHIGNSNQQDCHGDSGGPALLTVDGVETIIGVTSFGDDRSSSYVCINGAYDTRVDQYVDFINAHL